LKGKTLSFTGQNMTSVGLKKIENGKKNKHGHHEIRPRNGPVRCLRHRFGKGDTEIVVPGLRLPYFQTNRSVFHVFHDTTPVPMYGLPTIILTLLFGMPERRSATPSAGPDRLPEQPLSGVRESMFLSSAIQYKNLKATERSF
jgi:hypothetical protein